MMQQVRSGKVKGLGVTTLKPSAVGAGTARRSPIRRAGIRRGAVVGRARAGRCTEGDGREAECGDQPDTRHRRDEGVSGAGRCRAGADDARSVRRADPRGHPAVAARSRKTPAFNPSDPVAGVRPEATMPLKQRDYTPDAPGHARRRARARPLAPLRRQRADADPRRLRRGGDQGRAAGGRHAARLAHEGRPDALEDLRAQQEEPVPRAAQARGAEAAARSRALGRDVRRELPPRHAREDGARARDPARAQPEARHRAHLRLRPGRALPAASRLRHADRGHVGLRGDQRLRRPRAGAAADVSRRRRRRASTARPRR